MSRLVDYLKKYKKHKVDTGEQKMCVIAGLGNPGKQYEKTKHNAGFMVIDQLAKKHEINIGKLKYKALIGEGKISDARVIFIKPQTYMNLSGTAIREIMSFYKIPPENLIVIYDDFDVDLGKIRIRAKGSAGTHNGMKSIISEIQSQDFPRIRVGIGKEHESDVVDFVLSQFSKADERLIADAIEKASLAAAAIVTNGIDKAMNEYNTK